MFQVRNIVFLFLLMTLFALKNGYCDVINVQGESSSSVTVYITKRITSYEGVKNLRVKLWLPGSYSGGINTQKITGLYKTFTPYPADVSEFTDKLGNRQIELFWNKDIRIVQLDIQFNAELYSNFYPVLSNAPFPVVHAEDQEAFIWSTELAPAYDYLINYIGRTLSKNLYREIDVVNSVFLWLDKNIALQTTFDSKSENDALTVLKLRKGEEDGVCNLLCSLFKGMGIPARVVYGISFQKELQIETPDGSVVYNLPNDERFWVEIFFPDIGWTAYDPHGMWFGIIPHVIKLSHGPDSAYARELAIVEKGEFNILKDFIYDIKNDIQKLTFDGYETKDFNKLILSPPVSDLNLYSEEPDLNIEPLRVSEEKEELSPGESGILLENSDISKKLDIVATKNRVYAQQFTLHYPSTIKEIRLPLIKFSDDGRIWIEIYSDKEGKPHQKLFRTYSIRSTAVRYMMEENPWLSFPVGKKTSSRLKEGNYWIALRSSGSCIFNWHAYEGNVTGDSKDTRFMDVKLKKPHWNNILNFDLNYHLIGTREADNVP